MKIKSLGIVSIVFFLFSACNSNIEKSKPNILWIVVEDMSCHFGFQGEHLVHSPNVDQLAAEGVVYKNAYVSAPVCSASRSALITGMYQTSIGAHHHRSSRGKHKIHLPEGILTIPELFKEAGYYTCNSQEKFNRPGKEDYNFVYERKELYDSVDWSGRGEDQPFFAQIQLRGGKLRNVSKWYEEVNAEIPDVLVDAEDVELPPYYPNCCAFRKDWAAYLNSVSYTDIEVGKVMSRLNDDNLLDNTIIFFTTDHGVSQARGKQFLYDEGTRIPFIVWAPKYFKSGVKEELISHIDMAATSLELAGIEIPEYMDARPLFNKNHKPRQYVVSARDRCDETVDHIRSVRKGDYKYIINYLPDRPYLQACDYKDQKPWMTVLKEMDEKGELNEVQKLVTAKTRPQEELYKLSVDPFEINNLADDITYASKLKELRATLSSWIDETGDKGVTPESDESYDSSMEAYLQGFRKRNIQERIVSIESNIALMKKWEIENK